VVESEVEVVFYKNLAKGWNPLLTSCLNYLNKKNMKKEKDYIKNLIIKSSNFLKTSDLQKTKNILKKIFNSQDILKSVLFLDFMYSTNLSKNKYAIDDIVEYINSNKFKNLFKNIWKDTFLEISQNKFWLSNKKAISFFSKYFFYLTNFNFPIYDSLVIKSSKTIFNKKITAKNFYETLFEIKEEYQVTFEELDWFLWLFWKIKKWSYTTFLEKEEYKKLNEIYKKENSNLNLEDFEKILEELVNLKSLEKL